MQRSIQPDLDAWSRRHALAIAAGGVIGAALGRTWPLSVVAAASFVHLFVLARGRTTPTGESVTAGDRAGTSSFGAANTVTLVRLALILALPALPTHAFAATMLLVLALDGVDGFVARRTGTASAFGAHFDMESDALFIAIVTLEAWTRGRLGAWVLVAGALRYGYVMCLWAFPTKRGAEPRSLLARSAFLLLVLGLTAPWITDAAWGTALAAAGCGVVTASFARSFVHSYGRD
jgi:phosphatidylglycerophosphate synthase